MGATTKKFPLWAKIVSIALAVILVAVATLGITFVCVWSDEISTVNSFTHLRERNDDNLEGSVYSMKVKGGFYFDEYLKQGGASSDKELINFITNHITRGLIDMTIKETDLNCASFTAKTADGDMLFGRNYDNSKTNVCLTFCDPGEGRYKSFSTSSLNFVGMDPDKDVEGLMNKITCLAVPFTPLDGINEKGLSCGIYMTYQGGSPDGSMLEGTVATNQNDSTKKNITSTTMLRMILDYADSVDKAVELIQEYNLHDSANTSFHYMIADASGKSAILEWINGTDVTDNDGAARKLVVTYNTDAMYDDLRDGTAFQYQWVTNFIVKDHNSYYANDDLKPGYDRYVDIYDRLNATNGIVADENAAMDILEFVGRRTYKPAENLCTVHSVVYNLTKKTVLWVANENFGVPGAVYSYSLETGEFKTLAA